VAFQCGAAPGVDSESGGSTYLVVDAVPCVATLAVGPACAGHIGRDHDLHRRCSSHVGQRPGAFNPPNPTCSASAPERNVPASPNNQSPGDNC
jgi:hypothetical protein